MPNRWRVGLVVCVVAAGIVSVRAIGRAGSTADERDAALIRAHIDRIFKAYIAKDRAEVEATHDKAWRGFLTGSRSIIKGLTDYMRAADTTLASPGARLAGYTMDEIDVQFRGPDVAIVPYVATLDGGGDAGRSTWKLRVLDVYERQGGEWMQVASNTALHPESIADQRMRTRTLPPGERQELLAAREAVWRAWFGGDQAALGELVPDEVIALDAGPNGWSDKRGVLASSGDFVKQGGRLVALEFTRTEVQAYGSTAILYSRYRFETESKGKRSAQTGNAIEVFVNQHGSWVNPGWQLMPDPPAK